MTTFVEQGHLGGYIAGGDEATFFPDLWRWLVEEKDVRSVLDVGCGEGHAVDYFRSLGVDVWGVDGIDQGRDDIFVHDFTRSAWPIPRWRFDLVWCCEFVEHVEERFVPNFMRAFSCAKLVLMTHAEPGQQGYHHVNCRTWEYWVGAMAAIGYQLDPDLCNETRALAARNPAPYNHFARSGLAFRAAL